ncbi:MAG TPA: DUF4167 domain-containing protein [Pseudolabrys sp.]|nr:DUF4167 domain-containing protein [Pseudolabrys sp.]
MRNGQKRMRGRGNHRKSQNPLTRVYESNGPDVKIRGTASHIAEKYIQLARDAQGSGDPIAAENYYQHAEHYFRLIAAAQEQFRQQNPYYNQQQPQQGAPGAQPQGTDDSFDGEDDDAQPFMGQNEPSYAPREPQQQPYLPRDAQPFPPRDQQMHHRPPQQHQQPYHQHAQQSGEGGQDVGGLPAFITGAGGGQPQQNSGSNGHDQGDRNQDRFGMHRRRRRHRGGYRPDRPDFGGNQPQHVTQQPVQQDDGGNDEPRQPD